jgi:hypothetical protein
MKKLIACLALSTVAAFAAQTPGTTQAGGAQPATPTAKVKKHQKAKKHAHENTAPAASTAPSDSNKK